MKKTAVVLLNLGGPSSLDDIGPFLSSLFYDPAILPLPNPLRFLISQLISKLRKKEAHHIYSLLGGGSPLLKNTKLQARALNKVLGDGYKVFVCMRHASPRFSETMESIKKYCPQEIVLLPLYPQYSTTTTESSFKEWEQISKEVNVPLYCVPSYPTNEGFIEALVTLTRPYYDRAKESGSPKVILTAHGLPERCIKKKDPYQSQVEQTANSFIEKLCLNESEAILCYQSRVGPVKWIRPYADQEILKTSQERKPIVVVPLSFVSEHSETLVELDMTYRNLATQNGCPNYQRVPTVQIHPLFMKGLASLIQNNSLLLKEFTYVL